METYLANARTQVWDDVVVDLYTTHFDSLVKTARRYVHERTAAEEAVQEAFVRFHTTSAIDIAETPIAYLRTMVLNNARTMIRRQACRDRHRPTTATLPPSVDEICVANDEAAALRKACETLPAQQRAVLRLRYWRGLSEAEIAAELGISAGSVKTHASRGRRALHEVLGTAAA